MTALLFFSDLWRKSSGLCGSQGRVGSHYVGIMILHPGTIHKISRETQYYFFTLHCCIIGDVFYQAKHSHLIRRLFSRNNVFIVQFAKYLISKDFQNQIIDRCCACATVPTKCAISENLSDLI